MRLELNCFFLILGLGSFDKADYENGYSRNLLWRLWHAAKLLQMQHLFQLCSEVSSVTITTTLTAYLTCFPGEQALDSTMCEETVFWDQNYALQYKHLGTDQIQAKVAELARSLNNSLYTHANFVFLDAASIRQVQSAAAAFNKSCLNN